MSDPQPTPDTTGKPGMSVVQPAKAPSPQKTVPPPESSGEGQPDVIIKPGMSVGN